MGWDIEMYAELRRQNRWVLATPVVLNPYFDYSRPEEEPQQRPVEIYKERNSALFAILAGVGPLAGEESPFPCISPPRGVPSDLSSELATWHAQLDRLRAKVLAHWRALFFIFSPDVGREKIL